MAEKLVAADCTDPSEPKAYSEDTIDCATCCNLSSEKSRIVPRIFLSVGGRTRRYALNVDGHE